MCFELLGMDVILNHKLKPYLLEVNHTPSFNTDTPLDSLIKRNLISDTLKLMNVTVKFRNEVLIERKEAMQKRVLTGKKVKFS
jgi:tubulin polyglutamylase TTLL6/13